MTTNDLVLIKQLVNQRKDEVAPELSESEFFNIFSTEQALKDRDLSYEEIENGIVDGGGDGGIDAIFLFINNNLCREQIDQSEYKRGVPIELVFIQAKTTSGFTETGMDKLISSAKDLLDLNQSSKSLLAVYNSDLIEKIEIFRNCYIGLVSKFPRLIIRYFYAALATETHPNVGRKIDRLRETIESAFTPVEFSFEFLNASSLLSTARRTPTSVHQLQVSEAPISTGQKAYVCLANLGNYYQFITENGLLNERIFEGNVRDYQGNTEVNQKIRNTLSVPSEEDFWWLNNGISVLCTKATYSGKTLTVENPEIVNGLQTSREIYDALSSRQEPTDSRSLLVRIIQIHQEDSRNNIIRATNSQTTIPTASLRATDKIHRDIEDYLAARGLFYDRRKNYYKNLGKPVRKIVSISLLAQSVLACAMADPANARARPSSLIKRDDDYARIFNEGYPLDLYYNSPFLVLKVEDALRSEICEVPRSHWNNMRFYVAMFLTMRLINSIFPSARRVADIDLSQIKMNLIQDCISAVWNIYKGLGASDKVAKGTEFKKKILDFISEQFPSIRTKKIYRRINR